MNPVYAVVRWELINRVKSKAFILTTLIMPALILGMTVLPGLLLSKAGPGQKTFALVDETGILGERLSERLAEKYNGESGDPLFEITLIENDHPLEAIGEADAMIESENVDGYIHLQADILDSGTANYVSAGRVSLMDSRRIERTVQEIVEEARMIERGVDPVVMTEISRPINFESFEYTEEGERKSGNEFLSMMTPFFIVFIFFMAVFGSSQILMRSVLEERQNRVVEVLLSSLTAGELMNGKIIGLGLVGLLQITPYVIIALLMSAYKGIEIIAVADLPLYFIYFMLGYFFWASFYAMIGSLFTSEQEAAQVVGVLVLIFVIPLALSIPLAENPNGVLAVALSYVPPITPMLMILRISSAKIPAYEIVLTISILLLTVWVMMKAAGRVFRTAILIYGKRPTVPEIWRWMITK